MSQKGSVSVRAIVGLCVLGVLLANACGTGGPAGTDEVGVTKIVASDAEVGDYFGGSIAIDGDYCIAGAMYQADMHTGAGAAYIFHRTGTDTWDTGTKIVAPDPATNDYFGRSVAISGDYCIVGAPWKTNVFGQAGAAYVFRRTGVDSWDSGTKLLAWDPDANDHFGHSVAISGDYCVVGAPDEQDGINGTGSAYIFRRTGTNTWDAGTKVFASDPQTDDHFGWSVAISGDYSVVGAYLEDAGGTDAGAAYVLQRTGTDPDYNVWSWPTKIVAPDAQYNENFGASVAIAGDYCVVGAPFEHDGVDDTGAAYVYRRTGPNTWDTGTKIKASDPEQGDEAGFSVTIDGDRCFVGARFEDAGGAAAGAAYAYQRTGTDPTPNEWSSGTKIMAPDADTSDAFGWAVATSGDYCVIGARYEGGTAGAAYVYKLW